ncbi:MAG: hypothetical protein IH945_08590 [Armatimonadetes bacterium]|nr:hypothetical protein [Armatimonadota bacterium]
MVLSVPFEGFVESARKHARSSEAFVSAHGSGTVVTAADPEKGVLMRAESDLAVGEVRKLLSAAGMSVYDGCWGGSADGSAAEHWVGAVAYKSSGDTPGLWVETFSSKPTTGQVLSALYDEFRDSGDVGEIPLEEFIRLADPNVVILGPEEQAEFAARQDDRA